MNDVDRGKKQTADRQRTQPESIMRIAAILGICVTVLAAAGLLVAGEARQPASEPTPLIAKERWKKPAFKYDVTHSPVFSPNLSTVLLGGSDGVVRFFDAKDGTISKSHRAHDEPIRILAYQPRTSRLVIGAGIGKTASLSVLRADEAEKPLTIVPHSSSTTQAVFSRDGKLFVTMGLDRLAGVSIKIWNAEGTELKQTIQQNVVRSMSLSADNKLLAFCIFVTRAG